MNCPKWFIAAAAIIGENARVMTAAAALEQNDLAAFGRLMSESHRSLSDDCQVSCDELNLLVELAGRVEGVYGARMMGGGFGGCVISLVAAESVAEFERVVAQGYQQTSAARQRYTFAIRPKELSDYDCSGHGRGGLYQQLGPRNC